MKHEYIFHVAHVRTTMLFKEIEKQLQETSTYFQLRSMLLYFRQIAKCSEQVSNCNTDEALR